MCPVGFGATNLCMFQGTGSCYMTDTVSISAPVSSRMRLSTFGNLRGHVVSSRLLHTFDNLRQYDGFMIAVTPLQ
jgi:hypothetical protein